MMTVFFPNPYLDERFKPQKPDWSRLALWNAMRLKYLPGATEWKPNDLAQKRAVRSSRTA